MNKKLVALIAAVVVAAVGYFGWYAPKQEAMKAAEAAAVAAADEAAAAEAAAAAAAEAAAAEAAAAEQAAADAAAAEAAAAEQAAADAAAAVEAAAAEAAATAEAATTEEPAATEEAAPLASIEDLLAADPVDLEAVKSVIAASALDDATKTQLAKAIDTSANFPGLLSNVLERVKSALSN